MATHEDNARFKMFNGKNFTKMYAASAEKLTSYFAAQLIKATNLDQVSDDEELVVLDQAYGTGVVSKELTYILNDKQKANLELTCADIADSMIEFVGPRIKDFGLKSAVAVKADAMNIKLPSNKFTNIFLNFGPLIFSDGQAGLRELHRLLRPGGTLAMSSWMKVGWIEDVKAALATDPDIPAFPPYEEFRKIMNAGGIWDEPAWIRDAVPKSGFIEVNVREVPHTSSIMGIDELTRLMAGMVGLIQQQTWTQEQRERYKDRANNAFVSYMKSKYGDSVIEWEWVATLTTAKKGT